MTYKCMFLSALFVFLFSMEQLYSKPPHEYQIESINFDKVLEAKEAYFIYHDLDSDIRSHFCFVSCINSILELFGDEYRLKKQLDGDNEVSIAVYIDSLNNNGIRIYKLKKLKGKALRAIVSEDIPVMVYGSLTVPYRNIKFAHADVIFQYRTPDFVQSKRKLDDDIVYRMKTGLKGMVDCKEFFAPSKQIDYSGALRLRLSTSVTIRNTPSRVDYGSFDYYCIISTPKVSLKEIKRRINACLDDVDFKYQIPEFRELRSKSIDW